MTVECPRCGKPAWRKTKTRFVHDATIELDAKNQPVLRLAHYHTFVNPADREG